MCQFTSMSDLPHTTVSCCILKVCLNCRAILNIVPMLSKVKDLEIRSDHACNNCLLSFYVKKNYERCVFWKLSFIFCQSDMKALSLGPQLNGKVPSLGPQLDEKELSQQVDKICSHLDKDWSYLASWQKRYVIWQVLVIWQGLLWGVSDWRV